MPRDHHTESRAAGSEFVAFADPVNDHVVDGKKQQHTLFSYREALAPISRMREVISGRWPPSNSFRRPFLLFV